MSTNPPVADNGFEGIARRMARAIPEPPRVAVKRRVSWAGLKANQTLENIATPGVLYKVEDPSDRGVNLVPETDQLSSPNISPIRLENRDWPAEWRRVRRTGKRARVFSLKNGAV